MLLESMMRYCSDHHFLLSFCISVVLHHHHECVIAYGGLVTTTTTTTMTTMTTTTSIIKILQVYKVLLFNVQSLCFSDTERLFHILFVRLSLRCIPTKYAGVIGFIYSS